MDPNPKDAKASKIILLNGVSSSGKSSIAKILQAKLETPYLHACIDAFEEMMPPRSESEWGVKWQPAFDKMISGFHHSLAALAQSGNNLIVDHVLLERDEPRSWVPECLTLLAPYDVILVGVRCPLEVLEQREKERGDRPSGLARWQFERMHLEIVYDFEVDTGAHTPEQCAMQIIAALPTPPTGLAATLAKIQCDPPAMNGG